MKYPRIGELGGEAFTAVQIQKQISKKQISDVAGKSCKSSTGQAEPIAQYFSVINITYTVIWGLRRGTIL